ncbi:hypothetical protein FE697_000805 [Mumia zhuanghuii]|uniref:LVIVD repeat-containing protein n=2 Tax=Mumia TaxID=1546255 RepID=A0ABW1QQK4_9ACTN|nr:MULTISPECIES: hypothetical protein [Mumia]KAA1424504.1 hypothetical protein FE697_000805 [Mumia zhuanghuii]
MRPTHGARLGRLLTISAGAGVLVLASLAGATPSVGVPDDGSGAESPAPAVTSQRMAASGDPGDVLGVGEVASSRNMKLLSNIPKNGAFAPESAFNSDLAFSGRYAYAGNYNGFTVYDVKKGSSPTQVAQVLCPGSQNDVSVYGNLLVLSTDSSRSDDSCASVTQPATVKESWEGLKIFDISQPTNPRYIKSVETKCGSHTHTLAPSKNKKDLYVYVSSYFPNLTFPDCQPPHDLISVVKIPVKNPTAAAVVDEPVLFPDGGFEGGPGPTPIADLSATSGCHDITAYPTKDIAAGACMGDGVIFDIRDRANPKVIEQVRDTENFAFWHSATFNNAGTKVVFTDELGGGGAATCNPEIGPERGANAIYDLTKKNDLVFKSYYKISRTQAATENCVAHNGSLIPVPGKDIMVQAWYQGGISVWDFTNSAKPKEIAWFDRGPLSADRLILGGSWSAYWYNGYIYSNDIQQGLDTLAVKDVRLLGAYGYDYDELNPQSQPKIKHRWNWRR